MKEMKRLTWAVQGRRINIGRGRAAEAPGDRFYLKRINGGFVCSVIILTDAMG
jgi:hypothetical protein